MFATWADAVAAIRNLTGTPCRYDVAGIAEDAFAWDGSRYVPTFRGMSDLAILFDAYRIASA